MNNITRGLFWLHDLLEGEMIETDLYNKDAVTFPYAVPGETAHIAELLSVRLRQLGNPKHFNLVHTRSSISPKYLPTREGTK